jgi:hypothetical protein
MLGFGPRIARHGVSLRFSPGELAATRGAIYLRVRRARLIATALELTVGAAFLAGGLNGLVG